MGRRESDYYNYYNNNYPVFNPYVTAYRSYPYHEAINSPDTPLCPPRLYDSCNPCQNPCASKLCPKRCGNDTGKFNKLCGNCFTSPRSFRSPRY